MGNAWDGLTEGEIHRLQWIHSRMMSFTAFSPSYAMSQYRLDGETIAARLKRGPLPGKTASTYARQIAAALVEAHAKGIVTAI